MNEGKKRSVDAINTFLEATGLSVDKWEKISGVGEGGLAKFLNQPNRRMGLSTIEKLVAGAQTLGHTISVMQLQGLIPFPLQPRAPDGRAVRAGELADDGKYLDLSTTRNQSEVIVRNVPFRRARPDDEWGDYLVDGDSSEKHAVRPPHLWGRSDIRALEIQTDRMEPRYCVGEVVLLEERTPEVGDHVFIEFLPEGNQSRRAAVLRQLKKHDKATLTLFQYKPARESVVARKDIAAMFRVLTTKDLIS